MKRRTKIPKKILQKFHLKKGLLKLIKSRLKNNKARRLILIMIKVRCRKNNLIMKFN
jgi:hypothetical protein